MSAKVSLFATCILNNFYPDVAFSVVRVLSKLGVELTELRKDQAEYIGVTVDGPFKGDEYRY